MKSSLFITVLIFSFSVYSQSLKNLSPEEIMQFSADFEYPDQSLGFSDDLPARFLDMVDYVPLVVEQEGGSCVGHTIANSISITHNVYNGITDIYKKFIHKFDPYYIYASLKEPSCFNTSTECECGTYIWEGLDLAMNYGIKKSFVGPSYECADFVTNSKNKTLQSKTKLYTIDTYYAGIEYDESGRKTVYTDFLKSGMYFMGYAPVVVIGVDDDYNYVGDSGEYKLPTAGSWDGLHAVTMVGYDDYKNGGSFLFVNSWGPDWGDEGYFWITYKDFEINGQLAFIIDLTEETADMWTQQGYWDEDYYKGYMYVDGEKTSTKFEGTVNLQSNLFDGQLNLIDGDGFCGAGEYENGFRNDWWMLFDYNNDFFGWVLYDKGQVVDTDSFGFSAGAEKNKSKRMGEYKLDIYDIELSEEDGTEDDFDGGTLDEFENQNSPKN